MTEVASDVVPVKGKRRIPKPTAQQLLTSLNVALSIFLIAYLMLYVSGERARSECQGRVNVAVIESLKARTSASGIADAAFDALLTGLRTHPEDVAELIAITQEARARAAAIRTDNPYPDPYCG